MSRTFGIGELARETGCNIETIRYYERIGVIPQPPRTGGRAIGRAALPLDLRDVQASAVASSARHTLIHRQQR
jgi:MerR family regulatory protein